MISKSEYDVLCALLKSRKIDLEKNVTELDALKRDKLIRLHNVMFKNINNVLDFGYDGFEVTQNGKRAVEEYETFIKTEERDKATLSVAKKANELSAESNNIAKSANQKSRNANILSLFAIIIPSLISIGALIVSIFAYLKN